MKTQSLLGALAGFAAAAALAFTWSAPAYARPPGPPPGGFHGGPGFHRPPPPPPGSHRPPPPPRHRHHRRYWNDWGFWGPLALGGIIVGAELYNRPERVEVVRRAAGCARSTCAAVCLVLVPDRARFLSGGGNLPGAVGGCDGNKRNQSAAAAAMKGSTGIKRLDGAFSASSSRFYRTVRFALLQLSVYGSSRPAPSSSSEKPRYDAS